MIVHKLLSYTRQQWTAARAGPRLSGHSLHSSCERYTAIHDVWRPPLKAASFLQCAGGTCHLTPAPPVWRVVGGAEQLEGERRIKLDTVLTDDSMP